MKRSHAGMSCKPCLHARHISACVPATAARKGSQAPSQPLPLLYHAYNDIVVRTLPSLTHPPHHPPPTPLSKLQLECPYHGWRFNGSGDCTTMPSTVHCRGVHVAALPCVEKDGFLWVWPGEDEPGEVRCLCLRLSGLKRVSQGCRAGMRVGEGAPRHVRRPLLEAEEGSWGVGVFQM